MSNDVNDENYEGDFMDKSLCKDCIHRIKRQIKPVESTLDEWEEELGIEITKDTILETNICKELQIELDHYVLSCSSYEQRNSKYFLDNINKIKK